MRTFAPVWDGYLADPFILMTPSGYYALGTDGPTHEARRSSGREFPVLFSPNLVDWEFMGGALEVPESLEGQHFWAPEVAAKDGRFFLYYSAGGEQGDGQVLRVAVSSHPAGPYVDQGHTLLPDEGFSIDASPFYDPLTGQRYLFFAKDFFDEPVGTGIAVTRLADDMVRVEGVVQTVIRATQDWQVFEENRLWYGKRWPRWHTCEGPSVVFRHGRYYLFFSGGNWQREGYGVSFAVSDEPDRGFRIPFADSGRRVLRSLPGALIGPGHNSLTVGADGVDRIVFHAWNPAQDRRQMYVEPLAWMERDGVMTPEVAGTEGFEPTWPTSG